jgi:hypothetical protein
MGFKWKAVSAIDGGEEMCNKWVFVRGAPGLSELWGNPGSRRKHNAQQYE